MSRSPACAVNGRATAASSSTFTTAAATGWHDFKVGGYSELRGLGIARHVKSGTFVIGGHGWCITYFPDGLSHTDADWICFGLHLERHRGGDSGGDVTVRTQFSLLNQVGEPSSYTSFNSNVRTFSGTFRSWANPRFIKRDEFLSSYVTDDGFFCVRCHVTVLDAAVRSTHQPPPATTVLPPPPPPPDMHRHLGELLASGVGADVTLEVGSEEGRGPCEDRRHRAGGVQRIRALLHFIYTDMFPEIEQGDRVVAMAQHLLIAADRYDLERLKSLCEYVLCICVSASVAVTTLVLAEKHECHQLKQECLRILKSRDKYKEVLVGDDFEYLASSCPSLLDELHEAPSLLDERHEAPSLLDELHEASIFDLMEKIEL